MLLKCPILAIRLCLCLFVVVIKSSFVLKLVFKFEMAIHSSSLMLNGAWRRLALQLKFVSIRNVCVRQTHQFQCLFVTFYTKCYEVAAHEANFDSDWLTSLIAI